MVGPILNIPLIFLMAGRRWYDVAVNRGLVPHKTGRTPSIFPMILQRHVDDVGKFGVHADLGQGSICVAILAAMRLSLLIPKHKGILMLDSFSLECENTLVESDLVRFSAHTQRGKPRRVTLSTPRQGRRFANSTRRASTSRVRVASSASLAI